MHPLLQTLHLTVKAVAAGEVKQFAKGGAQWGQGQNCVQRAGPRAGTLTLSMQPSFQEGG